MLPRTSALALVAAVTFAAAPARATTFAYTGDFQSFTAPTTGTYNIQAYGGQGGSSLYSSFIGGLGAQVGGDFTLTAGEVLTVLVGGMGGFGGQGNIIAGDPGGGGGGGSFVYTPLVGPYIPTLFHSAPTVFPSPATVGYVPLAIAAGGGGTFSIGDAPTGGQGSRPTGGPGGIGGLGSDLSGASGAGFYGDADAGKSGGGFAPHNGGQGGNDLFFIEYGPNADGHGGFGGGGGGTGHDATGGGGGGGGGGYSGGNGVQVGGGQGGYSFLADGTPVNADYFTTSSAHAGDGLVTINLLSGISAVPEPATWAMMILGMGAIGGAMRRQRNVSTRVKFA